MESAPLKQNFLNKKFFKFFLIVLTAKMEEAREKK